MQDHNAVLGLNRFADLTQAEFNKMYTQEISSDDLDDPEVQSRLVDDSFFSYKELPKSVNWVDKGAVTAAKDQGKDCAASWAFSANGALESHYAIKNKKLVSFAEQQLVDCDKWNQGCKGGKASTAFAYTMQYGMEPEYYYPYIDKQGQCKYDDSKTYKTNTEYRYI